jgi:hypothetical protein
MSPVSRVDTEADVPGVSLNVRVATGPDIDGAEFLAGLRVKHAEIIRRNPVDRVGCEIDERQQQFSLFQYVSHRNPLTICKDFFENFSFLPAL